MGLLRKRRVLREPSVAGLAAVAVCAAIVAWPGEAAAQATIQGVVSFLMTNRSIPTDDFVQDEQVAGAARDAIADALLTGLATLPVSASASGFTYRIDSTLGGAAVRSSGSFGAFFTERSLTVGRLHGSVGVSYQRIEFDRIDGYSLRDGSLVGTATSLGTDPQPFDVETLSLRIDTDTLTLTGNVGVSDRLDVGAALPFVRLALRGERIDTYRGRTLLQAAASSSASGPGDLVLRAKYNVMRKADMGVAIAVETQLPTGDEQDLLGSGHAAFRPRVVWSIERGRAALDANAGYTFSGLSNEISYGAAVTVIGGPRVMVVGEIAGRRLTSVSRLVETSAPHPRLAGIDTIRLSAEDGASSRVAAIGGVKWNPTATWLIGMNVLRRMTDAGLTASWVPALTIEYAFGR